MIVLGTNDSRANNWDAPDRKARFLGDYGKLVDHFQALRSHPTVYVGLPPATGPSTCCGIRGDVLTKQITPALRDLARERGLPVIDLAAKTAGHPRLLVDGVHPNDKGYELLAETVREALAASPPKSARPAPWWKRLSF